MGVVQFLTAMGLFIGQPKPFFELLQDLGFYLPFTSQNCKPPPHEGWGIFDRNNGEFSTGIDITMLQRQRQASF